MLHGDPVRNLKLHIYFIPLLPPGFTRQMNSQEEVISTGVRYWGISLQSLAASDARDTGLVQSARPESHLEKRNAAGRTKEWPCCFLSPPSFP